VTYGVSAGEGAPPSGRSTQSIRPAPVVAPSAAAALKLVAYRGEQPKGFTIDKVPDGWEVQGVTASALTIAPIGFPDQSPDSFVGKIVVMLQSADDNSTPKGTKVTVAGRPGVINKPADENTATKNLWVKQKNGAWLLVQIWDATGWTQQEIVEFGAGIHVLKGAQPGRG
jgi:hypothetical protein